MKKKIFFVFSWLTYFAIAGYAQDIIIMANGEDIQAKVSEINDSEVRYKNFSNLQGPDFVIRSSDIFMIKYENGSKDVFEKNPATGKVQIRHIATPESGNSAPIQILLEMPSPVQNKETLDDFGVKFGDAENLKENEIPQPESGETLYLGETKMGNGAKCRLSFNLSKNKRRMNNLIAYFTDMPKDAVAKWSDSQDISISTYTVKNTGDISVKSGGTDISLSDFKIIRLVVTDKGATARIACSYLSFNKKKIEMGEADIFLKELGIKN
jgi:hypothetical protein